MKQTGAKRPQTKRAPRNAPRLVALPGGRATTSVKGGRRNHVATESLTLVHEGFEIR